MLALFILGCSESLSEVSVDYLAATPACTSHDGDGRLDLDLGCADGACSSATYDEWVVALGDPGECSQSSTGSNVRCEWSQGIRTYFDDDDADGLPDAGDAAGVVYVSPPYDGLTQEGLGLGVSLRCYTDALGDPSRRMATACRTGSSTT